ncbi:MAG: carbonic anhydrase [Gemmatimonadetes bacterium]|nr:carbonic anhydrase [Gemmatimonadota bacterium]MBK9691945.1 carbonic anhydrase [Gemmatimonadota bacterium]
MNKLGMALGGVGTFLGAAVLGFVVLLAREARTAGHEVQALRGQVAELQAQLATGADQARTGHGRANVLTSFNPDVNLPRFKETAFVDPMASVIGDVQLGGGVYVAPFASLRGDEGQPIALGDETNVQDGVVLHALETESHGQPVANRTYEVNGRKYAVYVGKRVSLAHQSQVHGPARIDDDVFVGMQALVFKAWVGRGSVIEPGAKVIGVTVPPGRYVRAGTVLTDQKLADQLPEITEDYPFKGLNEAVVHVNTSFAESYGAAARPAPAEGEAGAAGGHGEVAAQTAPAEHH